MECFLACETISELNTHSGPKVDTITEKLKNSPAVGGSGILVDSIHGERHQTDRNAALSALRKGKIGVLIATDVAARGLDVCDVMTVINFDPARNLDSHVHRIGRAGRLDKNSPIHKKGVAYTLLTPKNMDFAHTLVEALGREGREVNEDLLKLAMNSKYSGVKGGYMRHNRYGLGFVGGDDAQKKRKRSSFL